MDNIFNFKIISFFSIAFLKTLNVTDNRLAYYNGIFREAYTGYYFYGYFILTENIQKRFAKSIPSLRKAQIKASKKKPLKIQKFQINYYGV